MTYPWQHAGPRSYTPPAKGFMFLMGIYQSLSVLLIPIFWIIARRRLALGKEETHRIAQRFGLPTVQRPKESVLWIHSASIGETRMALMLAHQILQNRPDVTVLMTTQTISAAQFVPSHPKIIHHMVPFDSVLYVRRFFRYWKPYQGVIFESERWPNLYYEASRFGIPLIIANAQMSERSMRWWKYGKYFLSNMFKSCALILTSSTTVKRRFLVIDAALPLYETPSLKYLVSSDSLDGADINPLDKEKTMLFQGRPYWLASCVHESELAFIYQTHQRLRREFPNLLLILIPRHPDKPIAWDNTAYWSCDQEISPSIQAYVVDGFGQTAYFYRRARFCVFGGSFKPIGGHNIIEPVAQGCAVLHGPYTYAAPELYESFVESQASCLLETPDALFQAVLAFIKAPENAAAQAHHAFKVYRLKQAEAQAYVTFLAQLCTHVKS